MQAIAIRSSRSAHTANLPVPAPLPAAPRTLRREPVSDWAAVLADLAKGEPTAIARVTGVLMGLIVRAKIFDLENAWEDICQDSLTALIRAVQRGAIRDPNAFVGYAATTVRHEISRALERHRRARNQEEPTDDNLLAEPARRDEDPDVRIDLERAVAALPDRQRLVVTAIYLEGRSYEEASERLGLPLGTLKRLQTEGLRTLRAHLGVAA
jgi:RNA polymerase sigma factor (sigma-70 family)